MYQRRLLVDSVCKNLKTAPITNPTRFYNILVDDNRKLLFCVVPKVASTSWKRALGLSSGHENVYNITIHQPDGLQAIGIKRLNEYNIEEIMEKIRTYVKVIFVRNPFSRLISAYKDKFERYNALFWWKYDAIIKNLYRKDHPHDGTITFAEFLRFIADGEQLNDTYDHHWETYSALCMPCLVRYHFIGHMETMAQDAPYILRNITTTDKIVALPPPKTKHTSLQREKWGTYYRTVTGDIIEKIKSVYRLDFMMFGYNDVLWSPLIYNQHINRQKKLLITQM